MKDMYFISATGITHSHGFCISTTEIYNFFEGLSRQDLSLVLPQTLPRFSFPMGFLPGSTTRVFFLLGWITAWAGSLVKFFLSRIQAETLPHTAGSWQKLGFLVGCRVATVYFVSMGKSFLYGICY